MMHLYNRNRNPNKFLEKKKLILAQRFFFVHFNSESERMEILKPKIKKII